jgi:hypothetical protein
LGASEPTPQPPMDSIGSGPSWCLPIPQEFPVPDEALFGYRTARERITMLLLQHNEIVRVSLSYLSRRSIWSICVCCNGGILRGVNEGCRGWSLNVRTDDNVQRARFSQVTGSELCPQNVTCPLYSHQMSPSPEVGNPPSPHARILHGQVGQDLPRARNHGVRSGNFARAESIPVSENKRHLSILSYGK